MVRDLLLAVKSMHGSYFSVRNGRFWLRNVLLYDPGHLMRQRCAIRKITRLKPTPGS